MVKVEEMTDDAECDDNTDEEYVVDALTKTVFYDLAYFKRVWANINELEYKDETERTFVVLENLEKKTQELQCNMFVAPLTRIARSTDGRMIKLLLPNSKFPKSAFGIYDIVIHTTDCAKILLVIHRRNEVRQTWETSSDADKRVHTVPWLKMDNVLRYEDLVVAYAVISDSRYWPGVINGCSVKQLYVLS